MNNRKSHWIKERMQDSLQQREIKGTLRRLILYDVDDETTTDASSSSSSTSRAVDFASNDYLGLAQSQLQRQRVAQAIATGAMKKLRCLGATGSRLLSGDSLEFHDLENFLSRIHKSEAALLCNSGYDANLSVVSSLPCDIIVYDEYIHNSIHMGMRLWKTYGNGERDTDRECWDFRHNNVQDLQRVLCSIRSGDKNRRVVIIVESVYSMDGDVAPLQEILDLALEHEALVVIDEAHGLGVFGVYGAGVAEECNLQNHPAMAFRVYTFGKAAGCHGAVVICDRLSKNYLINYAYPFIYSTALPSHSLTTIRCAYETMTSVTGVRLRQDLRQNIHWFRNQLIPMLRSFPQVHLLPSTTAIQALVIPGNAECTQFCQDLYALSHIRLYPIKSPTVPKNQERVRIIVHAHNTRKEIQSLIDAILKVLMQQKQQLKSRL
jgi:8-amino-7-oxononanoate synthase